VFQLSARSLSVSYATRPVLEDISVSLGPGERLGLIGQNGAGKSTLLRLLSGREEPDHGAVVRQGSTGYLAQEPELPAGASIGEAIDGALAEFRTLETRMRHLETAMSSGDQAVLIEYGDVLAAYEDRDGWSADARAAKALAGLGLGDLAIERTVDTLSGGQRARLALALALVRAPEILLLDEPTNHLDDDALGFLESALLERRGITVAASHDRAFLDAVCTSILDLDPTLVVTADGTPVVAPARYTGAYSEYLDGKAAAHLRWAQAYQRWTDEVDEMRATVRQTARTVGHGPRPRRDNDKFAAHFFGQRVDAAVARRVRDAEQRLDRLQRNRIPKPPRPLRLSASLATRTPDGVLIAARDVDVPGRVSVDALDITSQTRLLVTGPNGAGKSSLLELLAGTLTPTTGRVIHARGLRVGRLAQEPAFEDPSVTALEAYAAGRGGALEDQQARLLELGLLGGSDLNTPVGRLSVGQQRRLALARMLSTDPQVLLLDEPTNHLSLGLVEELEEAVRSARVAVVVVSHDRWLRGRWTGETLGLPIVN
jgi:macrolide transport system ATP-binding/permease protein